MPRSCNQHTTIDVAVGDFARRGGWWVAAQVGIFAGYVLAMSRQADVPPAVQGVGWALAIVGAAAALGGLVTLGPNLTPYPEPLTGAELIERGVYRLVRHPIYAGLCVGAAGLALARGSIAALVVALGLLVFFRVKAQGEELRLETAYPGYASYRERVRFMLIPWVL